MMLRTDDNKRSPDSLSHCPWRRPRGHSAYVPGACLYQPYYNGVGARARMVFLSRTLSPSRRVWLSGSGKRVMSKDNLDHERIDHSSVGQRDGDHRLEPTAVSRSPMQAYAQAVVINWWVSLNLPSYAKWRIRKLKSRRKWYRTHGPHHSKPWWSRISIRS